MDISDVRDLHPGDRTDELEQLTYEAYRRTPEWYTMRRLVLERENHTCAFCGRGRDDARQLHLHHRTYERCPNRERLSDLTILCGRCHERHHDVESDTITAST